MLLMYSNIYDMIKISMFVIPFMVSKANCPFLLFHILTPPTHKIVLGGLCYKIETKMN